MNKAEIRHIKELGTVYIKNGTYTLSGTNEVLPTYQEIDILDYLEKCLYNDKLQTYMKYRNSQRYYERYTCGGKEMVKSSSGKYVKGESGNFIDIDSLRKELNDKDVFYMIDKFNTEHKNDVRYSWDPDIEPSGSYYPDPNGGFVYVKGMGFVEVPTEDTL